MARIAIPVTQNAILFCCSEQQPVVVHGELVAVWQRNLFDEIEIERCSFALRPPEQTVACRVCHAALRLAAADVHYLLGALSPDQMRQAVRFRPAGEAVRCCADDLVRAAIVARTTRE